MTTHTAIPLRNAAALLFEAGKSVDEVNNIFKDLESKGKIISGYVYIDPILEATGNTLANAIAN